jgi:hypothetical protein
MSIEVINEDDELLSGYVNLPTNPPKSLPSLGIKRSKRGKINGLAFNNEQQLRKAIDFLKEAYKELYGPLPKS